MDKNKTAVNSPLELKLTFHGSRDIPAPELPSVDGVKINYVGPSTQMLISGRRMSSSISHVYMLYPQRPGGFRIPPVTVEHKGKKYTSEAIEIEVVKEKVSTREESGLNIDLSDKAFLVMEAGKNHVFREDPFSVTISLYVRDVTLTDIRYPVIQGEGFTVRSFERPRRSRERLHGNIYDVLRFNTDIVAHEAGKMNIGPARLKCNLVLKKEPGRSGFFEDEFFGGFFREYKKYTLTISSLELPVEVLPAPEGGPTFRGHELEL